MPIPMSAMAASCVAGRDRPGVGPLSPRSRLAGQSRYAFGLAHNRAGWSKCSGIGSAKALPYLREAADLAGEVARRAEIALRRGRRRCSGARAACEASQAWRACRSHAR